MKNTHSSYHSVSEIHCHICAHPVIDLIPGYERFRQVTSDCKIWKSGGHLGVCSVCGCVQKVIDRWWRTDVERIYDAYTIYHQSNGIEQAVFAQNGGSASSRSAYLLKRVFAAIQLPERGCLLDFGCGNGALLRTFAQFGPHWTLAGSEVNNTYRSAVEQIERVEAFYTCSLEHIPGSFDLITMIHVLEHIVNPQAFFDTLWNKLAFGGLLLIEVPHYVQNPFDLLIADHSTHFTPDTLIPLLLNTGYEIVISATDWVPKELTIVARKRDAHQKKYTQNSFHHSRNSVEISIEWLAAVVTAAHECSKQENFGLFGTSIAATWLFGELEGAIQFFVDEDRSRIGKMYMGRPVFHPSDIPVTSHVYIVLPTILAESIQRRLERPGVTFYVPPPLHSPHS